MPDVDRRSDVQLRAKVMDLLTYLAARPGEVVSKEQLLDDVWGSRAVSESALTRTVTELRQALGDNAEAPHLLETIPKRGYRLIGSVVSVDPRRAGSPSPRVQPRTQAQRVRGGRRPAHRCSRAGVGSRDTPMTPVRLAVLPFDHIGVEPAREYLADGLPKTPPCPSV